MRRSVRIDNSVDTSAGYAISATANIDNDVITTIGDGSVSVGGVEVARWTRFRTESLTIRYNVAAGRSDILAAIEAFCADAQASVSA